MQATLLHETGLTAVYAGTGQTHKVVGREVEAETETGAEAEAPLSLSPTTTLSFSSLLALTHAPSFIHLVSVDIEGSELAALSTFPFEKYKVGVFIVERAIYVMQLLEEQGYKLRTVQNQGEDW